jgi:hypothetical protein
VLEVGVRKDPARKPQLIFLEDVQEAGPYYAEERFRCATSSDPDNDGTNFICLLAPAGTKAADLEGQVIYAEPVASGRTDWRIR